ncbi:MAG: cadherin-like domain-containing protein [Anaerolineae bacterium]|nr:cadherin-like domain-containing protein [Anaerolineae bacterium]
MSEGNETILEKRRRTRRMLIGIILATLPCYFLGIILLVTFSSREPEPTPTATLTATITETPTLTATVTPTVTPGGPTLTIAVTATQAAPPTETSTPTETLTPTATTTPNVGATQTIDALLTLASNGLTATAIAPTIAAQGTATQNAINDNATATQEAIESATHQAQANATATKQAQNATATQNALNLTATASASANTPPEANADSATTAPDTPITIDVLANDDDDDGDSLEITDYDDPSDEGSDVDCSSGTECVYTPKTGFTGPDVFTYTISDGNGGTDTAVVSVTVGP